jgi:hypothetical protein
LKSIAGKIDSFNLSCKNFDYLFTDKSKYSIEVVKGIGVFKPYRWSDTFGKALTREIKEAKIIHTHTGLTLTLKRYAVNPSMQTLEIAGLHSYNDKSKYLQEFLSDIWEHIQACYIRRIDIAIDFKKVPKRILIELNKKRISYTYKNTEYFKSEKEKKENSRLNFKIYNKTKKENLDYQVERFETVFKGSYFQNIQVQDMAQQFSRLSKTIKRFSGQEVKIIPIK